MSGARASVRDDVRPLPERVVVYRLGSLGDTIVALPCFHAIAKAFPGAERIALTNIPISSKAAALEAILGGSGLIDRYMAYPVGTRSLKALAALRASLRALDTRTLVYLTAGRGRLATLRDLIYFRLCGFTRIVGAPLASDLHDNRRAADGTIERECSRLARCMAPLGPIELDDAAAWDLRLTSAERDEADALLGTAAGRPRITINMGGKSANVDWGIANWRALMTIVGEQYGDLTLVVVGAAEDSVRALEIGALWPAPIVNLCGRGTPRVSAAAMAGSRLFIGHDSGPLHLAACMGVPCVSMFGNNNAPRKWHPPGPAHRILHDMRGVMAIGVEQVAAAVLERLATTSAREAQALP